MIYEVAISTISKPPLASGHQRVQEGDIVCIRKPLGYVGKKEQEAFLWVRIDMTEEEAQGFMTPDTDEEGNPIKGLAKRKYRMSLEDIKAEFPDLDLPKVRDQRQKYQPILDIDEAGRVRAEFPLMPKGLIKKK